MGLYRDNGQENGNYRDSRGHRTSPMKLGHPGRCTACDPRWDRAKCRESIQEELKINPEQERDFSALVFLFGRICAKDPLVLGGGCTGT